MPERRGSRFALEIVFLLALAGALALANLDPLPIAGVMLLGWVVAAVFEWSAWRGEAHYGGGLPPRYYVPQVNLPPRRALEQVGGYPEQRDEAPTWIASAAMRDELLGEWPAAIYADAEAKVEDDPPDPGQQPHDDESALAAEPGLSDEQQTAPEQVVVPAEVAAEADEPPVSPPAMAEAEPPPDAEVEPGEDANDPGLAADEPVAEDGVEKVPEEVPPRRRFWQRARQHGAEPGATERPDEPEEANDTTPDVEVEVAAPPPLPSSPETALVAAPVGARARHSLDPLAEPERRRRLWERGGDPDAFSVEVPARPDGVRALPTRTSGVRGARED